MKILALADRRINNLKEILNNNELTHIWFDTYSPKAILHWHTYDYWNFI